MTRPQQIKIISDGTGYGTQILNSDGTPIPGVRSLSIDIVGPGALVTAVLEFECVYLEMKAQAELPVDERIEGSE